MLSRYLSLLSILISLSVPALADANSTCYYPNGVANHGQPCNPDADVSVCCGPTFVCLSNGLCQVGPDTKSTRAYKFYRSGCTDPTFSSPSCPQICKGSKYNLDGGEGLQSCGNDEYCCAENYNCCTKSSNIFKLGVADIITTIPAASGSKTTESSSSETGSAASGTGAASSGTSSPTPSGGSSNGRAIGIGIGVGLGGLLVVCAVVWLLLRRRRAQKAAARSGEMTAKSGETAELSSSQPMPYAQPDTKAAHSGESRNGITHELVGEGRSGYGPHEMDAQDAFELDGTGPEPRDGGFKPYDGYGGYEQKRI